MANPLDTYLETIAHGSMEKKAAQETFGPASVEELAKLAGIKLAENVCTSCGSCMEKLGSVYKCECGMMKKAHQLPEPEVIKTAATKCGSCGMEKNETADGVKCGCGVKVGADEQFVEPGRQRGMRGALNALTGSPSGLVYKQDAADRVQSGALKGLGIGAGVGGVGGGLAGALASGKKERLLGALAGAVPGLLAGGVMGAGIGAGRGESGYLKDKGITSKGFFMPKHRFTPEAAEKYLEREEEPVKEGSLVKAADFAKAAEAFNAFNGDLEKVAAYLEAEGMSKEAIGGILSAIGSTAKNVGGHLLRGSGKGALTGLKRGGKVIKGRAQQLGGDIAKTWKGTEGNILQRGWQTAKAHPGTAIPAAAALGVGGGAAAYKMASAEEVGDAAGRILAKAAALDMDELRESVEEAKEREDIAGRAKQWQIGGGVGGAAGGGALGAGAGFGVSKLMGGKGKLLAPLIGAGVGAAGGGVAGQHFGKQHGAEEAAADKMVSMLRALRAHRMGAQAGGQAGYDMGYQHGQGAGA